LNTQYNKKYTMKRSLYFIAFLALISLHSSAESILINKLPADTLKKGKNYLLFSKSENINNIRFSKEKKSTDNVLNITFGYPAPIPSSNAVNGTVITSKRYNEDGAAPIFDKIDILKGNYAAVKTNKDTKYRNSFTFTSVEYPLRLKLFSGAESIDLELTEAGEWNLWIELKNN
jgi:hypothetical protein